METKQLSLRKLYGDIIVGYTKGVFKKQTLYIRHISPLEQGVIDGASIDFYDQAVSKGLQSEKEKLEGLYASELWSEENETFIANQTRYIEGLNTTKKNLVYESQVEELNKQIEQASLALHSKNAERAELLGLTAEEFSKNKLNELYIFSSIFHDSEFKEQFFSYEEFDELDNSEFVEIMRFYNTQLSSLNTENIKKIAISPFFQHPFALCDDNIYDFYGKPIVKLTFFQTELASFGRFFKFILSGEQKPPEELLEEPDKLIDWYNTSKNAEKMMQGHSQNSNVAAVGATAKDLQALAGGDMEIVSFQKIAAEQGKKTLNRDDLMKILG